MKPVSPVIPGETLPELLIAKDQQHLYIPLPALVLSRGEQGPEVVSRWELTDDDRKRIAEGASVYVHVMTFGRSMLPIVLTTKTNLMPETWRDRVIDVSRQVPT